MSKVISLLLPAVLLLAAACSSAGNPEADREAMQTGKVIEAARAGSSSLPMARPDCEAGQEAVDMGGTLGWQCVGTEADGTVEYRTVTTSERRQSAEPSISDSMSSVSVSPCDGVAAWLQFIMETAYAYIQPRNFWNSGEDRSCRVWFNTGTGGLPCGTMAEIFNSRLGRELGGDVARVRPSSTGGCRWVIWVDAVAVDRSLG